MMAATCEESFKSFLARRKREYSLKFPFLKDSQIVAKLKRIWSQGRERRTTKRNGGTHFTGSRSKSGYKVMSFSVDSSLDNSCSQSSENEVHQDGSTLHRNIPSQPKSTTSRHHQRKCLAPLNETTLQEAVSPNDVTICSPAGPGGNSKKERSPSKEEDALQQPKGKRKTKFVHWMSPSYEHGNVSSRGASEWVEEKFEDLRQSLDSVSEVKILTEENVQIAPPSLSPILNTLPSLQSHRLTVDQLLHENSRGQTRDNLELHVCEQVRSSDLPRNAELSVATDAEVSASDGLLSSHKSVSFAGKQVGDSAQSDTTDSSHISIEAPILLNKHQDGHRQDIDLDGGDLGGTDRCSVTEQSRTLSPSPYMGRVTRQRAAMQRARLEDAKAQERAGCPPSAKRVRLAASDTNTLMEDTPIQTESLSVEQKPVDACTTEQNQCVVVEANQEDQPPKKVPALSPVKQNFMCDLFLPLTPDRLKYDFYSEVPSYSNSDNTTSQRRVFRSAVNESGSNFYSMFTNETDIFM